MKYKLVKIPNDIKLPVVVVKEGVSNLPLPSLMATMRKKYREPNTKYRLSYENGAALIFSTSKVEEVKEVVSRNEVLQEAIDVVNAVYSDMIEQHCDELIEAIVVKLEELKEEEWYTLREKNSLGI